MWNARLDEAQAGINIARRHINNLKYTDNTTLMAESEELKSLLMKAKKESEKVGSKFNLQKTRASLVAQMVKCLPAMWETWVQSLGWEDPVEKEMATHSSTLAWNIPWTDEPDRLQSMGSQRVGHDWTTSLTHSNSLMHPCHYKPFYMKSNFPKDDGLL